MTTHAGTEKVQGSTPGPWYVLAPEPRLPFYISADPQDHHAGEVAVVYGKDSEADARLIAAAPELLAALKLAYPLLTDKAAKEEIGALLNKVEGRSHATPRAG